MGGDGYCAKDCAGLGQLTCPAGAVCEQLGGQAVLCMDGCCSQDDCRDGFRCDRKPEIDIYQDLALCPEPGICVASCTSDAGCPQGTVCDLQSGNCVPRVGAGSGVGAACTAADQCNSGNCLSAYPGGYCTSACGSQFGTCEAGSECYAWRGATATCMARCQTDAQCRAGYRCEVSAEQDDGSNVRAFCVPRCDAFGNCPDGMNCDPGTGRCIDGAVPASPIGAFCNGNDDCASGNCNTAWPSGSCTASCGTCSDGAVCINGSCQAACSTANDCRFKYVCISGGCSPGCTSDTSCGAALVCDTASGLCVSPTVGSVTQEFATTTIQVSASGSNDVTFEVPANALSAVIHIDDGGGDTLMAPLQLVGPGNTTLYNIQDPASSRLTFLPTTGTFTGMFPNGPNINLVPGSYRVSFVRNDGTASTNVRIFGKVASGFPARQELGLAMYFVGNVAGLSASSAPNDPRFVTALNELRSLYDTLGVTTLAPTYHDLPGGALRTIDSVNGTNSELSQLFKQGTLDGVLQFYFVDEIIGGAEGFTILGIAGGIPGPPGLARGPHSGVAITTVGAIDRPALMGQVMAHEGAHFLGLFHTSEATGTAHDPLPDTVQCPASRDRNWDGYISVEECAGAGADNFMFWAASGASRGTSTEQGRVVRRNPLTK